MTDKEKREYMAIWHLLCTLSEMCAASPEKITDLLTGYLWDEEEASYLKQIENSPLPMDDHASSSTLGDTGSGCSATTNIQT